MLLVVVREHCQGREIYLLAVAHYNDINVVRIAPLLQILRDAVFVINVQKASLWPPKQPGEVFNCIAFGRGVDNRKHLLQVHLDELEIRKSSMSKSIIGDGIELKESHLVKQDFILHPHAVHERVLGQIITPAFVLIIGPRNLLFQSLYIRRQQAV